MKPIIWMQIKQHLSDSEREEIDKRVKEIFKDFTEEGVVVVTYGDVNLSVFGIPFLKYPNWLFKLKTLIKSLW